MAKRNTFRSKFEYDNALDLEDRGVPYAYETLRIEWLDCHKRRYTPDFVLPNGIIVETKGRFLPKDRQRHLEIRQQHPTLDIRFVFQRKTTPINKGSKTTVADWCDKHGFKWSEKTIPQEWVEEE